MPFDVSTYLGRRIGTYVHDDLVTREDISVLGRGLGAVKPSSAGRESKFLPTTAILAQPGAA